MDEFECIELGFEGPVCRLTIRRPEVLNALSEQVIAEMEAALTKHIPASSARVVVLQSTGEKAFIAGADIAGMQSMSVSQAESFARQGQRVTTLLEELPQVSIARVQGFALGGGCEMAMACDIVVAAKSAKFGQPEINLGIIAGFGGTQRLVRRVGLPMAMDILCAGRSLSGEDAVKHGLAARAVDAEDLDKEVNKIIKGVLRGGPNAVAQTKKMVRYANDHGLRDGLGEEAATFSTCFAGQESKEGISAFLEKRSASFSAG